MVKDQKSLVKGRKSKKRVRRKVMYLFKKPAAKEYEKIILVQEQIIKAREHTLKIYERVLKQISSKSIIKMENGVQPFEDELLVEGMYKAWDGFPTNSSAS